jgi:hypothetical protein
MRRNGSLKRISRRRQDRRGPRWERQSVRHALHRLGERYGLALDRAAYDALCAAVRHALEGSGGSPLGGRRIHRCGPHVTWHLVRIEGKPVVAVYDSRPGRIVTFLELRESLAQIGLKLEDVA